MGKSRKIPMQLCLALLLLMAVNVIPATPAHAAAEDVAMFYDALASYGNWVNYGNYGPVWYPTQGVTANWRPYMDGRWVPTEQGWVFETSEPWGWATYHWGNWMPTTEYGWVWSPGSTWYPSTAAWRTSDQYVGWAPIPPPDYVPEQAYYPSGGYYPDMPIIDLISAPFWIFAQAANFLLGFGEPFEPVYSYYNCGCLAPFGYGPVAFAQTAFLSDFYYPYYAHRGYYCYGPRFPFVSRVTGFNITTINNYVRRVNYIHMRNVLPPARFMERHPFIRDAVPAAVREGRGFQVHRAANPGVAAQHLAHPGVIGPPAGVPRLSKEIPRGVTPKAQPAAPIGRQAVLGAARGAPKIVTPREGQAPAGVFRAPGREQVPVRGFHGPAGVGMAPRPEQRMPQEFRGTTMPPTATHEFTPRMQHQVTQQRRFQPRTFQSPVYRPTPQFRAPSPREFRAPAPSRPSPGFRPAPSRPAPSPHGGGGPGGHR